MAASIAIVPASGSVISKISACRVTVSGADDNLAASFNASNVPSMDPIRYRLKATHSGADTLVSHEFTVSADGHHVWDNVIFPYQGTWVIHLENVVGPTDNATLSVNVL